MEQLIEKIERLKAEYQALQPIPPDFQKKLDKKLRLEFNFNSNHLEGNTLTYGETELLLIFDNTHGGHTMREYEEMKAHDVAYALIRQWAEDPRPITEADIKSLNKVLLVRPYWKDAITPDGQATRRQILVGEYKKQPNSVRLANGELFEYATPIETPIKMAELMEWFATEDKSPTAHVLAVAALLHYKFVRIHPFDDGNGRISRLLMNYVLIKNGYPPIIIKSADKANYLRALNLADTGDEPAFVKYIGEQLVWSLELCIKAAKGEDLEEPDDLDKELAILQKKLTGKTTLEQRKTPENVIAAVEHGLIPAFQLIEHKLQAVVPGFFETERNIRPIMFDSTLALKLGQSESDWAILKKWLRSAIGSREKFAGLTYTFDLKGFKGNMKGQSVQAYLSIAFNDYNYVVNDIPYGYGQALTPEQIQEMIRPVIKHVIDQINQLNNT